MFIVYLIQNNATKEKYIGITEDLKQRLITHNAKGKKFTTRKMGEWILIYAEAYRSKEDAAQRERQLKRHANTKINLLKRLTQSLF